MGRVVAAGRAAGCGVIHAIAAHRPDLEGSSQNSPLFRSIARNGLLQLVGTPLVDVIDEIPIAASDLRSTRLHGISPVSGTGTVLMPSVMPPMSRTPASISWAGRALGADTEQVISEWRDGCTARQLKGMTAPCPRRTRSPFP